MPGSTVEKLNLLHMLVCDHLIKTLSIDKKYTVHTTKKKKA